MKLGADASMLEYCVISFLRTVVFEVAAILILPIFFKLDGI